MTNEHRLTYAAAFAAGALAAAIYHDARGPNMRPVEPANPFDDNAPEWYAWSFGYRGFSDMLANFES